jgi:hypothetical protein
MERLDTAVLRQRWVQFVPLGSSYEYSSPARERLRPCCPFIHSFTCIHHKVTNFWLPTQVAAMQHDSSTYIDHPSDAADFERWQAGFDMAAAQPLIDKTLAENTFLSELQVSDSVVPCSRAGCISTPPLVT